MRFSAMVFSSPGFMPAAASILRIMACVCEEYISMITKPITAGTVANWRQRHNIVTEVGRHGKNYMSNTKLMQVKRNGDLKIEGEITRYEQRNKSVSSEGYSAQAELSITVNVRFTNNKEHKEDFEKQFSAHASYDTTQSLNAVQEELVTQMIKEICDQIFNATVANW